MKLLAIAFASAALCGCTQPLQKSNPTVLREMADKAEQTCGKGNVKSVAISSFQCREKNP